MQILCKFYANFMQISFKWISFDNGNCMQILCKFYANFMQFYLISI